MANPAAVYCQEMGYTYRIVDGSLGQGGECVFPQGSCDEWDFLNGKCGQEYNYCAKLGMQTTVEKDGKNAYSQEYAVCLPQDGAASTPLTELFDLGQKLEQSSCSQEVLMSSKAETKSPEKHYPTLSESMQRLDSQSSPTLTTSTTQAFFNYFPFILNNRFVSTVFDWRNYQGSNWLTPVRNQGICGSCWAFAATGVAEAAFNINSNDPNLDINLSEQYLVSDCDSHSGDCCGGYEYYALAFIKDSGVPDEACMPYEDGKDCDCDANCLSNRTCSDRCSNWESRLHNLSNSGLLASSDPATIKQKLRQDGPLAAGLGYGSYYGGYFDSNRVYHCLWDDGANHAIVLVGYDDTGGYWIVRNSWGSTWNGDGYFKVGYGECFIEQEVSYGVAFSE